MQITDLYVYPIKSFAGIRLEEAEISDIGFRFDRYWMLVQEDGFFITQREMPELVLFQLELKEDCLSVAYQDKTIEIPKTLTAFEEIECEVWGEKVLAHKENAEINDWFSTILKQKVYLVRKTDHSKRPVKRHETSFINFPDASQYLILGQASLDHLNAKLETAIDVNRFRANIIFSGADAHIEDIWTTIRIGTSTFQVTKACGRCMMTTINQENAAVGKEPLRTLATYRVKNKKVLFGQYLKLVHSDNRLLKVGDIIAQ